jgi:uncharacterized membrane protein
MEKNDIEFNIRLIGMTIFLIASFSTDEVIESQFLMSLSIISGLSLIRQISNNNK